MLRHYPIPTLISGAGSNEAQSHVWPSKSDSNLQAVEKLARSRVQLPTYHPILHAAPTCRTCNELNAGYAADGYCRRKGVGACVFTYCVGGLSIINAAAGCYSEDLPVIFISGVQHRGSMCLLLYRGAVPVLGE